MDFEFNQSKTLSSNGVTPVRTVKDVLIEYHLANGGTNVTLSLRYWTGSVWGPEQALGASVALGSINSSAILAADSGGLGSLSPRTFGEATISLAAIVPAGCTSFGSAYVKSRSADSFSAEIKDFIAPITLNINNCGGITIVKNTIGGTGSFSYSSTGGLTSPSTFSIDTTSTNPNSRVFTGLNPGSYTVTETVTAGWNFTSLSCTSSRTGTSASQNGTTTEADITLAAGGNVTCTYTNTKQATLTVNKVLVPATDAGLFNLQINGTTAGTGANVGNGGTTGAVVEAPGTYTAGKTSGTGTSLDNYTTVISGDCTATGSVTLAAGDNKTCTITNTRKLYTVIVLVCYQGDNTLYSSNVTVDGTAKNSISAVPAALTGVTESDLCTKLTGGARYVDKLSGAHTAALTIPTTEATPSP